MKKLKASNERKKVEAIAATIVKGVGDGIRNYDPKVKPIRFKRLTLETEDGLIFEVPGLQIREMSVVTPLEMSDGPGVPKGQFIKNVGPQEVTIVFQTFGINWPNRTRYAIEEEVRNLTPKSRQLPPPKQLPEHK